MLTCLSENQEIDIDDYQSEEQILELRAWSNNGLLRCPDPKCGGMVVLHKCNLKRSHFAHRVKGDQCRISEESAEHDLAKSWIYNILRNQYPPECVKKESFVDSGQKADILLITPTQKFAIEIQFSPQSDEVWIQRTTDYQKAGIVPLWIIGIRNELADALEGNNTYSYQRGISAVRNLDFYERSIVRNIKFRPTWEKAGVEMHHGSALAHLIANRNQPAIYHFVSVLNKESTAEHRFHSAVIWKENDEHKSGFLIDLDETVSFSEKEGRFISKAEFDYAKIYAARNEEQAIELEKRRIELLRRKESRAKFIEHLLNKFQIASPEQFPEVKAQENALRQNKNLRRIFHVNKSVYPNEDYLLIELAVYIKFVKLSKPGSKFDMEEIKSYLVQWGLWDDIRFQSINAWIAGLLQNLVLAGILSKSKVDRKPAWVLLTTEITLLLTNPPKSNNAMPNT